VSSNAPKSDICTFPRVSTTSSATTVGSGVSSDVGDSDSVSSIDDGFLVGADVGVVGLGDSPETFVGDSDSDGDFVSSINDGFSAGA
jgi:hypothetical protein